MLTYPHVLLSLIAAALFGGIIGFERAGKNHDAGLRTHILVCLGAASVMLLSRLISQNTAQIDITRLGAQVISGIGFLGVGCIIITGDRVKGLTTAAGLWTTACLGLIVGMGYYLFAFTLLALMLLAVLGLRPIARRFQQSSCELTLRITVSSRVALGVLLLHLKSADIEASSIHLEQTLDEGGVRVLVEGCSRNFVDKNELSAQLCALEGINGIDFI